MEVENNTAQVKKAEDNSTVALTSFVPAASAQILSL